MRRFWDRLTHHRAVSLVFGASVLVIVSGWLRAHLALSGTKLPIIFHWTGLEGITQIVLPGEVAVTLGGIAGTGVVMVLVNSLLALELAEREVFWWKVLTFGTATLAALIFIAFTAIIAVN
jgi:hypothetical protein